MKPPTEVELLALEMWREREMKFPLRVRRMVPDRMDIWSGAWQKMVEKAEATIKEKAPE